jgi:plasmid maintenance system antidote protein VapI
MTIMQTQSIPPARILAVPNEDTMDVHQRLAMESVDPNSFLDTLIVKMRLENDAALARKLQVNRRIIEMLRERKLQVSPSMLMMIQRMVGLNVRELYDLVMNSA